MQSNSSQPDIPEDGSAISISVGSEQSGLLPPSSSDTFSASGRARVTGMTQAELLTSLSNRLLHSKFYKWLYLAMMILSLFCLVLSFIQQCPSGIYYWLDALVNIIMIVEVLIRVNAMGKQLLGRNTPAAIDFSNAAPTVDYLGGSGILGNASIDLNRSGIGSNARVASSVFAFEGEEEDWGF
ncbi:hypothetical protein BCR33DRAFT_789042 [Rhizoclosmatium globosum]|uniref:Ion transport domain-containing protein n=1 Tax=Rhizoclosmatium globosum TaxID=329046 RepID=A0A1Y2BTM9_9FUNG|nr:hypothetical protein BCR33DRAFT_789042 [Rhizoclosmatium globosum]|eukprot:ORY38118.1 hypothetical protein BCR33DRAFT_789042 [Rhizoclosmatium globosum]